MSLPRHFSFVNPLDDPAEFTDDMGYEWYAARATRREWSRFWTRIQKHLVEAEKKLDQLKLLPMLQNE